MQRLLDMFRKRRRPTTGLRPHQVPARPPLDAIVSHAARVSMLGQEALVQLERLASLCQGPIVEIGPYIGGSTLAIASGARSKVVTVEIGGSNPDHPTIPSANIVADLRSN